MLKAELPEIFDQKRIVYGHEILNYIIKDFRCFSPSKSKIFVQPENKEEIQKNIISASEHRNAVLEAIPKSDQSRLIQPWIHYAVYTVGWKKGLYSFLVN